MIGLNASMKVINNYRKKLLIRLKSNHTIGTINEWIIDNYYMAVEQENVIKNGLYSSKFFKIRGARKTILENLIFKIIDENDYLMDFDKIMNKINKYQKKEEDFLSYLEIDYIYNFISLILINKLSFLCYKLDKREKTKDEIEKLFDNVDSAIDKLQDMDININDFYYIEELNYKIKMYGNKTEELFTKLNEVIKENDVNLKDVIKRSHNEKAHDNFLIANIFNSFKALNRIELEKIYSKVSYAEKALIGEAANIYDEMFENNKQVYRDQLVRNSRHKRLSEYEYAMEIVNLADENKQHVGELIFKRRNYELRIILYIIFIFSMTIGLSYWLSTTFGLWMIPILLVPMCTLVIEITNQFIIRISKRNVLGKMKFDKGVPEEYSTMIVVPTIIGKIDILEKVFDNLETYYLSNKSENLYFCLLADCSSEDSAKVPIDKAIASAGLERVRELNEKYGDKFHFVYRNRLYNDGEGQFLGFERKRGAVNHFNKLLLGKFSAKEQKKWFWCHTFGNFDKKIKYVIPLDRDSKLVLGTGLKLIGAMAHPMNKPVLSEDKKNVISGYGIMQPRVEIDIEVTDKSKFAQLFAGLGGLDIYTTAACHHYQDVFGEGFFTGKGIYDLEMFETVMDGTMPNNLILSHDMLEGAYLRCGYVNDLIIYDDYPSSYLKEATRYNRWTRGDWQISGWLFRNVRNQKNKKIKNPIRTISKWQLFDNLRRELLQISLVLIILLGVLYGNVYPGYYFVFACLVVLVPLLLYLFSRFFYRYKKDFFLKYYLNLIRGMVAMTNKAIVVIIMLPYEAYIHFDGITKALYRKNISKKNLLNWIESAEIERIMNDKFTTYVKSFIPNYIFAGLIFAIAYLFNAPALPLAYLLILLWVSAPIVMWILSKSPDPDKSELNKLEKENIEKIAKDTWEYFHVFLNEENNYLIPDNYQLNRAEKKDHRTSPTNIAFSLTSVISAYELGFVDIYYSLNTLLNVIKAVEKLEKWNGQLFNWYDIYSMDKMNPAFISSVDNGNMISSLYVVKSFAELHNDSDLLHRVYKLIVDCDFSKLYNKELDLLSVGYDYTEGKLLDYHYSNLASEARLVSYVAIAKGDIPYKNWFCLDKTLTKYKGYKGVASWSGTAFEYFMPLIFMETYKHTVIDESYHFAFFAQKNFVREINRKLPWGISESAYNELDDSQNYKYRAFGIPYLKFKESPSYKIVISPYSSLMAIDINETEVYNNINKLKKLDMYGQYGFYESYDYDDKTIVKAYYAHHQGMSLAAITNYLKDNVIREYFHKNKEILSAEMLLKEKVQVDVYIDLKISRYKKQEYIPEMHDYGIREYNGIDNINEYSVISNGFYSVILNRNGEGFSKYKNLQVNRFRKFTDDSYGTFVYIKDMNTNKLWTNTYAPLNTVGEKYKTIFASDKAKYIRDDEGIVTTTEIIVPKDHTAEIRKITFKNNTNKKSELEVTSYSELIMCRNEEDIAHRTFNAITIKSEFDEDKKAIIYNRNSKTKKRTTYYIVNRMFLDKEDEFFEFETSKIKLVGRDGSIAKPLAIMENKKLSSVAGFSLDPIMSIRRKITIDPGEERCVYLLVGFGKSKEQVLNIVDTYYDETSVEKAFELSAVYSNMVDDYSKINANEKRIYNKVLKYIFDKNVSHKNRKEQLLNNKLFKDGLWKFGISGDLPIVAIEISKIDDILYVESVLKLYEFFKGKAIYIDIVIINNEDKTKENQIINKINKLLYRINNLNYFENTLGEVFHISSDDINEDEKNLIRTVSILSLDSNLSSSFEEQIDEFCEIRKHKKVEYSDTIETRLIKTPENIDFYNSYGGFINEGKEYYINNMPTPMPWINVLAGNNFGATISSNFGGFTYAMNSYEYRLTKWSNNITEDSPSESFIFNGSRFKPSTVTNGFGYTIMTCNTKEYNILIKIYVDTKKKLKYYNMDITNNLGKANNLNIDMLLKLVLGVNEEYTSNYIISEFDEINNRVIFKNTFNNIFRDNDVFVTSSEKIIKTDNFDVIDKKLSINVDFNASEAKNIIFTLGIVGEELSDANKAYDTVINAWEDKLGTIKINTPDKALNYALNGWYLYQIYSSRLMTKAAFYQAGGATGFRDQLQDIMSVIYNDPEFVRTQILEHAKHQFEDGSVLHWWHKEVLFGSRTNFSDDYLWLVYVTNEYIKITGDYSILNEEACYISGDVLVGKEMEKGTRYNYIDKTATLYEHMKLCIDRALSRFGKHGLPLMGTGDWNDGMSKIGREGIGESVFVGFFLYDLLNKMSEISTTKEDNKFSSKCISEAVNLKNALNKNAWDGHWYLRAFHDNGSSVGSRNNPECKIDLLSQSWSLLSGVIPEDRVKSVLKAVEDNLVDKNNNIIKLLTPPFGSFKNDPGYIKDYISGVRENGGQYTHAALWYVLALLKANNGVDAFKYYQMLNPINRSSNEKLINIYKTEPYVTSADVYSNEQAMGRGGWTWYTGSASWAYKIGIEEIIGFKKMGDILTINPHVDSSWKEYKIVYKYKTSTYNIKVIFDTKNSITIDDKEVSEIKLMDNQKNYDVVVRIKK